MEEEIGAIHAKQHRKPWKAYVHTAHIMFDQGAATDPRAYPLASVRVTIEGKISPHSSLLALCHRGGLLWDAMRGRLLVEISTHSSPAVDGRFADAVRTSGCFGLDAEPRIECEAAVAGGAQFGYNSVLGEDTTVSGCNTTPIAHCSLSSCS